MRTEKDRVITGESIRVQITREPWQESCRPIATATLREVVHRVGLLVSDVGPEVTLKTPLQTTDDRDGRVVRPHHRRLQDPLALQLVQRRKSSAANFTQSHRVLRAM